MHWKLSTLAAWCGGKISPDGFDADVSCVTSDSRKVTPGCLFVALKGEKNDGHAFAAEAVKNGAAAVLVSEKQEGDLPQIVCEDTLRAYGDMARAYRDSGDASVIGITGSVGKTSTKEMIADILSTTYKTTKTAGNHNNNLGLPMSVMDMPEDTEYAVLEMGMNHFGEMAYLTQIAKPNICLITNIGTMHIEHLGSREGILKAKLEILQGMDKKGTIVFNGDEPLLWNLREGKGHKKYYFGIENALCDVVAEHIEQMDEGMSFRVRGFGHSFEVFIPTEGIHTVYNALAAITVGLLCNVRPEKMQTALSHFRNTGMRQSISQQNGMTIIADCYNAGPESMEAALEVLGDRKTKGKRIAVLGDMLELGARSMAEHYRVGRIVANKADRLLVYGTYSDRSITGAITGGMDPKFCRHCSSHEEMARTLCEIAKPGDVILFKGSRGMKIENVMNLFLEMTKEKV